MTVPAGHWHFYSELQSRAGAFSCHIQPYFLLLLAWYLPSSLTLSRECNQARGMSNGFSQYSNREPLFTSPPQVYGFFIHAPTLQAGETEAQRGSRGVQPMTHSLYVAKDSYEQFDTHKRFVYVIFFFFTGWHRFTHELCR